MQRSICSPVILAVVTTAFLADVLRPEGLIGVWLYLVAMGFTLLPSLRDQAGALATFCSGLLIFGCSLRYPGIGVWGELAGRAVVLYGIWTTAAYCRQLLLLPSRRLRVRTRIERDGDNRPGDTLEPSPKPDSLLVWPTTARPELQGSPVSVRTTESTKALPATDPNTPEALYRGAEEEHENDPFSNLTQPSIDAKILFAEADHEYAAAVTDDLEALGAVVVRRTENVSDEVWSAERSGSPFHTLVLDTRLIAGHETIRQLRAGGFSLPIIALMPEQSDAEIDAEIDAWRDCGCNEVLARPCHRSLLVGKIKECVDDVCLVGQGLVAESTAS